MVATEKKGDEMELIKVKLQKKGVLFFKNAVRDGNNDSSFVVTIPKVFVDGGHIEPGTKYLFAIIEEVENED